MPAGLGRERLKRRLRRHIEERTNDPDPAEVLAKNRSGLLRADLAHPDLLVAPPPAQRRPARGANIPNPANLTVRSNQPPLAILNQDHRCRVRPATSSPAHTQQIGAPPSEPKAKQPRHEHIHQAAGKAKPIALRHPLTIAQVRTAPAHSQTRQVRTAPQPRMRSPGAPACRSSHRLLELVSVVLVVELRSRVALLRGSNTGETDASSELRDPKGPAPRWRGSGADV